PCSATPPHAACVRVSTETGARASADSRSSSDGHPARRPDRDRRGRNRRRTHPRGAAPGPRSGHLRVRAGPSVLQLPGSGRRAVGDRRVRGGTAGDSPGLAATDSRAGTLARSRGGRPGAAMSRRVRLGLFAFAGPGLLAVLLIGLRGLPAFGHYRNVYGLLVDKVEPGLRHATDIVTALNFDIRPFDPLGEGFILFA